MLADSTIRTSARLDRRPAGSFDSALATQYLLEPPRSRMPQSV